ncbi:MAG: hypothetical protein HC915_17970, partial [Anaerolineae bacterium]|nr:hypothetical protein [Anaerolineae bacterium]
QADARLQTTFTDGGGYYLFDDLPPGNYFVLVDEDNFRTGGVLVDYFSSNNPTAPADDDLDSDVNEDGIDDPTNISTATLPPNPEEIGIFSPVIQLRSEAETTAEVNYSSDTDAFGPTGQGRNGERPPNTNLTVDFGFYKPMSIGNRVWYDENQDGLISVGETGASGVQVLLFRDDGDGTFEPGSERNPADTSGGDQQVGGGPLDTDVTDARGYYLFDNLPPGNYWVQLAPANWTGVLQGLQSTVNVAAPPLDDSNDNGAPVPGDGHNYDADGIVSALITLALDGQPLNEADLSNNANDGPGFIGTNGETDRNTDITIDFGLTAAFMSLGNRVWLDENNDGLREPAEPGLEDVVLNLYRDLDANGTPDGAILQTTTTDENGHYLFQNLVPGTYVVAVAPQNFLPGGPLAGLGSTQTNIENTTPPEDGYLAADDDDNDNGIEPAAPLGILSGPITLVRNMERVDEADRGPQGDGTAPDGAPISPENSDLTVDFGFFRPLSVGNRVWFDTNDNGVQSVGEVGVAGVQVTLFRDDGNGVLEPSTDTLVDTLTTDANGYYLFDNLTPGNYFVRVDPVNFGDGRAAG